MSEYEPSETMRWWLDGLKGDNILPSSWGDKEDRPKIVKRGAVIPVSDEMAATISGFQRKSHYIPRELTEQEVADLRRANELLQEVEDNPYLVIGYEDDLHVVGPPTRDLVYDETVEEWLERWRAQK